MADAVAGAVADAAGGNFWLGLSMRLVPAPLLKAVLALWQRHGSKVWPPRRETAGYYIGGWATVMGLIYFLAIRTGESQEAEWESKRKRDYAKASLQNLLKYEEERVKEEAEAKTKKEAEEKAAKAAGTSDGAVAKPSTALAETKKTEEEKKMDGKDAKKKEAPDAKRMLELLFDEVEGGSITKLGVDESNDWYRKSVALLKQRVEIELKEAIEKTTKARGVMQADSNDPEVLAEMDEWQDGDKLLEKTKMVKEFVYKAFGKKLIDPRLMKEAKKVLADVASQRKAAMIR